MLVCWWSHSADIALKLTEGQAHHLQWDDRLSNWQADESSDNARDRLRVAIGQVDLELCPTPTHKLVVLPTGSSLQPCGLVLFGAAGPLAPISRQLWCVDERELHQFKCGVEGISASSHGNLCISISWHLGGFASLQGIRHLMKCGKVQGVFFIRNCSPHPYIPVTLNNPCLMDVWLNNHFRRKD